MRLYEASGIDEDRAATLIREHAPEGLRISREVWAGKNGLRFQFGSGLTIDWMNGRFTTFVGNPIEGL